MVGWAETQTEKSAPLLKGFGELEELSFCAENRGQQVVCQA